MVTSDGKPEYDTNNGLLSKRVGHAHVVAKGIEDFEMLIQNAIKEPRKSQSAYKVVCRNLDGKDWLHTVHPLIKGQIVAIQCNGTTVDRLKRKYNSRIDIVFA